MGKRIELRPMAIIEGTHLACIDKSKSHKRGLHD